MIQVDCDKVELSLKIHECFVTHIPPRADDELQSKEEGGGETVTDDTL